MLSVSNIGGFTIGPKIGQGAFGEIYVVRSTQDHKIYALKVEPLSSRKRILEMEANVIRKLHPSPYFPRFKGFGRTATYSWLAMELLGPSLATVVKRLPSNRLSVSSGLRVADGILCGLQSMHQKGFIHRDVKPSNILLRRSREYPIAVIDFGLSRIYVDRKTGKHLPARSHPGFRGTAVYASPNAHMHQDLSRRDDLISWFYLILDVITGPLPWKKLENRAEILHMKRRLAINNIAETIAPQLSTIWSHISSLEYFDTPDYDLLHSLIREACEEKGVRSSDEWDWHPMILQMDGSDEFSMDGKNKADDSSYESEATSKESFEVSSGRSKQRGVDPRPLLQGEGEIDCECCLLV